MSVTQEAGSTLITADAAVGTSGAATKVFAIHIVSDGTAGVVILRNGTSTGGTAYVTETGTVSTGKTVYFGDNGVLFPSGCYCDVDSHALTTLVAYAQG